MIDGLGLILKSFNSRVSVSSTDELGLGDIDAEEVSWSLHGESLQHKLRIAGVVLLRS